MTPHQKAAEGDAIINSDSEHKPQRLKVSEPITDTQAKLDEPTQAWIGHCLKAVYGEIVLQPVPSQFLDLLDALERKEKKE